MGPVASITYKPYLEAINYDSWSNIPKLCAAPANQKKVAHLSSYFLTLDASLAFLIPYALMLNRLTSASCYFEYSRLPPLFWRPCLALSAALFDILLNRLSSLLDGSLNASVRHSPRTVVSRPVSLSIPVIATLSRRPQSLLCSQTSHPDHQSRFHLAPRSGRPPTLLVLNHLIGLISLLVLSCVRPSTAHHNTTEGRSPTTLSTLRREIQSAVAALSRLLHRPRSLGILVAVPLAKLADRLAEVTLFFVQREFETDFAYTSRLLTYQTLEGLIFLVSSPRSSKAHHPEYLLLPHPLMQIFASLGQVSL
ncbi:hypothetical protein BDW72DRAFT_190254 [Aspergillus terricola var. indicus]